MPDEKKPSITLDRAVSYSVDYAKFIQTLWAAYIALIGATIGWVSSLTGKPDPLDETIRNTFIAAFCFASLIFIAVLHLNHGRLIKFMDLTEALAKSDDETLNDGKKVYSTAFEQGWTRHFLRASEIFVIAVAVMVSVFICKVGR